jgi:hypothetical protein
MYSSTLRNEGVLFWGLREVMNAGDRGISADVGQCCDWLRVPRSG